jgi:hypothetical protein
LNTDQGARVLLRLDGRFYQLSQPVLRRVLGLPKGPPGLGITIDRDCLRFDFAGDNQSLTIRAAQIRRRLAKRLATGVFKEG